MTLEELLDVSLVSAVTGYERALESAPASVTILKASEWQVKGVHTLSEALRGVVGVQTSLLNGSNSERQPYIRGLAGSFGQQVKILIDGIAINRIHHGGSPSLDIPLLGFKRIEIIRSAGSATYGADAFAGIINLVSEPSGEKQQKLSGVIGSFDEARIGVSGAAIYTDFDIAYTLQYNQFGDDPNRIMKADLQTVLDSVFATNASRAPGKFDSSYDQISLNLKANWRDMSLSYYGLTGSFGFGAGVAEVLDPEGEGHHHTQIIDAKYQLDKLGLEDAHLNIWYQDKHSEFPFTIFPAGAVLPIGKDGNLDFANPTSVALFTDGYIGHPSNRSEIGQINLTQVINQFKDHQIRWQVGFEHHEHKPGESKNFGPGVLTGTETVVTGKLTNVTKTPDAFLPEKSRHIYFVSIQDNWLISEDWTLNLGARFDDYSDVGSTTNPRFGLVWQTTDKLSIKALSTKAFRAPSFYDLYAVNNPINLGNPELKPETITTHELNVAYELTENLHTDFTFYQYAAKELIEYSPKENMTGLHAKNLGSIDGEGFEWQLRWRPNAQLDVQANFSRVNNEDSLGNSLAGFSEKMATLSLNYKMASNINLNLFSQYYGKQNREVSDVRPSLEDYIWSSARVSYQFESEPIELSLTVNNLGDEKAHYPSASIAEDYPIKGRQTLLQLVYQF